MIWNLIQRNGNMAKVFIKKMHEDAIIPSYQYSSDAGFDIHCINDMCIKPGCMILARTGLAMFFEPEYELQLRLRSSMATKTSLIMPNAPSTIDSGYVGEIMIPLRNIGSHTVNIKKHDRIAQGIIAPIERAVFVEVESLPQTERGQGGFGSTGN